MVRPPRPIAIVGDTGILPLTKGQQSVIDACEAHRVGDRCWFSAYDPKGKRFYASSAIVNSRGRKSTMKLHRFILGITDPKTVVDHINHDSLDNRRSNLRACVHAENGSNCLMYRNNTTGFKGVAIDKDGSYRAFIRVRGMRHDKCGFKTAEAAHTYREEVLSKLHGEFYCAG